MRAKDPGDPGSHRDGDLFARDLVVLGFDTSAAYCAAALMRGGDLVASHIEPMARGQAERLMPLLEEMLAAEGLGWRDLDGIGTGTGPGNFTGIRISVAAARGLALSLGIPAVGVTRFEALAEGLPRPLAIAEDAGRDGISLQLFRSGAPPGPPELLSLEDAVRAVGAGPSGLTVGGSAAPLLAARSGAPLADGPLPPAEAIARIAAARIAAGAGAELPRPAPLYLRAPDAAPPSAPPPVLLP